MPDAVQQGFDPKSRMNRHEADWELVSVTSFDGLGRTQIERKFIAPGKGLDTREATALPFILDATPNADDRGNEAGTTTDERRYVVNPRMVGGQFAGLWTGGPVKWDDDQRAQVPKHQVTQTLTRTWPAGHGYTLDEAGRYVFSSAPTSLEYATAAAALMNHRPALASKFSSRLAFRDDVPGAYWREVTWRDFTHESMPYIEALRADKLVLGRILAYHFGAETVGYTAPAAAQGQEPAVEEAFSGAVEDLTCDIDPETNTVTVKCAVLLKQLQEPATVADLLALPRIEGPCERETLRAFGWTDVSDGEGYRYTHRWKWIDLKDTPAVRAMLEFGVHDKDVLPTLLSGPYAADRPTLVQGAADAANGRFAVGGKAWWRIVDQKIEADEKEGSLSFELVAANPEWFGSVGKLVTSAVENPDGAGRAERVVAPSLDHKTAEAVASAPPTDPDHVIAGVTREQVEGGVGEDVTIRKLRVWSWQGGDVPPGAVALDGVTASTARRTVTATRSSWDLTFERVKKSEAEGLLRAIGAQLTASGAQGRVVVREVRNADEGAVAIVLHAEGVEQKIFTEWLRTGTFFEELHRQLKFNVPESDLTPGGLDERTGDIVTSDRKPNDDGTFDETIDRSSPSEPRHVRFLTKSGRHGLAVAHDAFRNETAVPAELLDGEHAGSVQSNDHARFDGESVEVDDADETVHEEADTALSHTVTDRGPDVAGSPGAGGDGQVTRGALTTYPDGKTVGTETVETAKPASITFTTKEGSGHFVQDVTHVAFRNQTELPTTGREITSGSANINEFGRLDGQVSGRDNDKIDESVHEEADTALSHTVTDRGPDVAGSPGAGGDGQVTRGALTTYPDGKTVGTETVETAKPASITFTTKEGSGHFVQDVTHVAFRNQTELPETGKEITSGSASINEFGRLDGQVSGRDNENIDEKVHEEADTALSHTVTERGPDVAGSPGAGGDGQVTRGALTTYPDGKTVGTETVETAKPASITFTTKEGSGHFVQDVTHVAFRNQTELPETGKEITSGSASINEFGRLDGQVSGRDNDNIDETVHEEADTALSHTVTDRGPDVAGSPGAGGDGQVTRGALTTYPDGKTVGTETTETAKPASITFTTKEGSGHFVQDVTHVAFRNQTELPETGKEITSGSANINEFGRLDGQVSGRDNENIDESVHEEADTALSHTVTDRGPDVAGSPGAGGDGQVTRGALTTYPDGKTVGTETTETAKPASITFTTKEGSGHFVQDVTHTVFRNQTTMPEGSGDVTSGSASLNEFGRLDGQISSRDNDKIDESVHEETDGPLERSVRDRGPNVSGGGSGGDGTIVSSATTTYPDGKTVGATGTRTAKPKEWSFSYGVSRGNRSGTVTVRGWRNSPMQQGENPGDGQTCSMSQNANEFGLFDGHSVIEPDWGSSGGGAAGGTEKQTAEYQVTREEERRVRGTDGHLVDQTRQVRYKHSILAGNISLAEAVAHINGGSAGSRYQATRIRLGTGNYVPGYISDKVTVTKDPWPAL